MARTTAPAPEEEPQVPVEGEEQPLDEQVLPDTEGETDQNAPEEEPQEVTAMFRVYVNNLQEEPQRVRLLALPNVGIEEGERIGESPNAEVFAEIHNPALQGFFEVGKQYLVSITPLEE